MANNKAHDAPSEIDAEAGEVIVEGPGGLAVSFTPEAADATSDRLRHGARKAKDQKEGKRPPIDR